MSGISVKIMNLAASGRRQRSGAYQACIWKQFAHTPGALNGFCLNSSHPRCIGNTASFGLSNGENVSSTCFSSDSIPGSGTAVAVATVTKDALVELLCEDVFERAMPGLLGTGGAAPGGTVIVERRGEEILEVKKDRRGRMSLVAK